MTWFISNMIWSNGVAFLSAFGSRRLLSGFQKPPGWLWALEAVALVQNLTPLFTDYDCNRFCTLLQPSLWLRLCEPVATLHTTCRAL